MRSGMGKIGIAAGMPLPHFLCAVGRPAHNRETLRQVPQFCGIPTNDGTQGDRNRGGRLSESSLPEDESSASIGVYLWPKLALNTATGTWP